MFMPIRSHDWVAREGKESLVVSPVSNKELCESHSKDKVRNKGIHAHWFSGLPPDWCTFKLVTFLAFKSWPTWNVSWGTLK